MQTIILAGGEGTRLRPLTFNTPKPLVKIAGISAAERLLLRLKSFGVRSATLCTCFEAEKLREELGTSKCGVRLKYCREEVPLGTAGCVRAAWNGDDVTVLSGDGVSGFDYAKIWEFHEKHGADVTIVCREVDDPREYGLLTTDGDGRVTGFLEKPGYDECLTNLANTGAYVISKETVSRIPEGEKVDFARDVFPKLLSEGKKLFAYVERGFWYDVGDIPSLLECQRELLDADGMDVLIEKGASLGEGSLASGGTVLESGAAVGKGSRVISSLICENASVAGGADISEAVICSNVTAGEGLIMKRFSAIGEGCVIGSGVTVGEGARIAPRTKIPDGSIVRTDITDGSFSSLFFAEEGEAKGICGTEELLRFGMAAGTALLLESAVVGGSGDGTEAVALGLRSVGTSVYYLSGSGFGETVFAARTLECGYLFFVENGVRLVSSTSADLSRIEERKIEQAYNRGGFSISKRPAPLIDGAAASGMYLKHLRSLLPEKPLINAGLRSESIRETEIFSELFHSGEGEAVTFTVASDRRTVSAIAEGTVVPYENLLLLCCKSYFGRRRSVVLPPRAPLSCDSIAKESRSSAIRSDGKSALSLFCCDPLEMIFETVSYLSKRGISLTAAVAELPNIVYTKRIIETDEGLPKILSEGFSGTRAGSDIMLENGGARAFVRPLKSGKAVSMYIESVSAEAAKELSGDILDRLGIKRRSDESGSEDLSESSP